MSRFEAVPSQVEELVAKVVADKFTSLFGARFMTIFDTKKKITGGNITLARIKKMNDELKFMAMANTGETYDYALFIDHKVWIELEDRDKERLIYHELCHCEVSPDKDNIYGIKDHEIQGFYSESIYNIDDPRWAERLGLIAQSVYDPENNEMPEDTESEDSME